MKWSANGRASFLPSPRRAAKAGDRLAAEGMGRRAGRSLCRTRVDVIVERAGERTLRAARQQSIMRALDPKEVS